MCIRDSWNGHLQILAVWGGPNFKSGNQWAVWLVGGHSSWPDGPSPPGRSCRPDGNEYLSHILCHFIAFFWFGTVVVTVYYFSQVRLEIANVVPARIFFPSGASGREWSSGCSASLYWFGHDPNLEGPGTRPLLRHKPQSGHQRAIREVVLSVKVVDHLNKLFTWAGSIFFSF